MHENYQKNKNKTKNILLFFWCMCLLLCLLWKKIFVKIVCMQIQAYIDWFVYIMLSDIHFPAVKVVFVVAIWVLPLIYFSVNSRSCSALGNSCVKRTEYKAWNEKLSCKIFLSKLISLFLLVGCIKRQVFKSITFLKGNLMKFVKWILWIFSCFFFCFFFFWLFECKQMLNTK